MQLEAILEKVGLQKGVHYEKEKNYKNEEGDNQRLDYIIKMPDDKYLVLDSKVSLTAYSNYFDADDDVKQARFLKIIWTVCTLILKHWETRTIKIFMTSINRITY